MTLIDHAAKALCTAQGCEPSENELARAAEEVRAVLLAIREPSEPMIDRFVSRALCVSVHGESGWSNYAREQWRTMIDAALATP